jgi:hypothetical protein
MQDLDAIEQQLMREWEAGRDNPHKSACERTVPHPLPDVLARVTLAKDRLGRARFRYWFGPSRVDRSTFAILTCPETRCPRRQELIVQWNAQAMGERTSRAPRRADAHAGAPTLAREVTLEVDGTRYLAREAVFTLRLQCPRQAHQPVNIQLTGWDVFSPSGKGLAGGWDGEQPHLQTLDAVKNWLLQHTAEMA